MKDARREVARQRERLDATFGRVSSVDASDLEARADFAKYLCVRVSGYLETSITELLRAYAAQSSSPEVARYVAKDLEWFQNAKKTRILEIFGKFDSGWKADLEAYLVDEKADAVGTIVGNRHKIAHGEDSTVTVVQVLQLWDEVKKIVDHIADLLDPP